MRAPRPALLLVLLLISAGACDLLLDALPDDTPPRLKLRGTDSLPAVTADSTFELAGTAMDDRGVQKITYSAGEERNVQIDPGTVVPFRFTVVMADVADSLEVRAYDAAGNVGQIRVSMPVYDITPPRITMTEPTDYYQDWSNGHFRLVGSATDVHGVARVDVEYSRNWYTRHHLATLPADFDTALAVLEAIAAPVTVSVLASDTLGNESFAAFILPVDRIPPEIRPVAARPMSIADSVALLTIGVDDRGSGVTSVEAVSGGRTTVVDTSTVYQAVVEAQAAERTITMIAWDRVGNADSLSMAWLDTPFVSLDGAHRHACMLATDGTAYCLGRDYHGELGRGSVTIAGALPEPVAGGLAFQSIRTGPATTCGIDVAGTGYCWGSNLDGALGDGTRMDRYTPTEIAGGHVFAEIHPAGPQTCALDDGGTAYCWGLEAAAGPGTGSRILKPEAVPAPVELARLWTAPHGEHVCAVDPEGAAYCWGRTAGYDSTAALDAYDTTAVRIGDGPFVTVQPVASVGSWSEATPWTFAVRQDGTVKVFGGAADIQWIREDPPPGPFDAVIVAEGAVCTVSGTDAPWCGSALGPSVAWTDAGALGLVPVHYAAVPCFLTATGSLYCRPFWE